MISFVCSTRRKIGLLTIRFDFVKSNRTQTRLPLLSEYDGGQVSADNAENIII